MFWKSDIICILLEFLKSMEFCVIFCNILIQGLFNAFDENQDGHIDFRELACGISKCCRGSNAERQKCE